MNQTIYQFPPDFLWGTATAAHHVEGDLTNSWSAWEDEGGHVYQDQKHGRACEWRFGRWREDLDRMKDLNTNSHRLSVEWSRIQPSQDTWDEEVLAEYSDMIDTFLAKGVEPMVTLHHFTNPIWIEDNGGWLNTATVDHFTRYVEKVMTVLGDRVTFWCTINEPMVYTLQAFLVGFFNPGIKNPWKAYQASEYMMRAHAQAYHLIKSQYPTAQVSIAKHIVQFDAAPPKILNQLFTVLPRRVFNEAFINAAMSGEIEFPARRKVVLPELADTMDYVGLNFYQRYRMAFTPLRPPFINQIPDPSSPEPPPLWGEIYPQGIKNVLFNIYNKTKRPIYITETGTPDRGDAIRRWYIAKMVHAVWHAVNHNVPVKGIYFWSLLDSFEWTAGYNPDFRFGLYEVNFETQERIKRQSGDFYGDICAAGGLSIEMVNTHVPELRDELFPLSSPTDNVQLPHKSPLVP